MGKGYGVCGSVVSSLPGTIEPCSYIYIATNSTQLNSTELASSVGLSWVELSWQSVHSTPCFFYFSSWGASNAGIDRASGYVWLSVNGADHHPWLIERRHLHRFAAWWFHDLYELLAKHTLITRFITNRQNTPSPISFPLTLTAGQFCASSPTVKLMMKPKKFRYFQLQSGERVGPIYREGKE